METRTRVLALVAAVLMGGMLIAAARLPGLNGTYMAGHDGTNQQIVRVDDAGTLATGGPAADDAAATGNPVLIGCKHNTTPNTVEDGDVANCQADVRGNISFVPRYAGTVTGFAGATPAQDLPNAPFNLSVNSFALLFDGTAWDPDHSCPNSVAISVASGTTTELVALSGATFVRVCSFVITGDTAATTATFIDGTGSACATSPSNLTGAMRMVDEGNVSQTASRGALFTGRTGRALCITTATGAVTGFITYAQF